jgi:hypothetical protein
MQTTPSPEIADSDLKAVRQFLTADRPESAEAATPHTRLAKGAVPLRNGITRARFRSAARKEKA